MSILGKYEAFIADMVYASARANIGLFSPKVIRGYFDDTKEGAAQKLFFDSLLDSGFSRTPFQLVFPGQTAGLVKKLDSHEGPNEFHIRFYDSSSPQGYGIDIELEYDRFHPLHFSEQHHDPSALETLLDDVDTLNDEERSLISSQFCVRDYSRDCHNIAARDHDRTISRVPAADRLIPLAGCYAALGVFDAIQALFTGDSLFATAEQPYLSGLLVDISLLYAAHGILGWRDLITYGTQDPEAIRTIAVENLLLESSG